MLYTIIDIYEVMRTDEIYPQFSESNIQDIGTQENYINTICTDPYKFLQNI